MKREQDSYCDNHTECTKLSRTEFAGVVRCKMTRTFDCEEGVDAETDSNGYVVVFNAMTQPEELALLY